MCGNLGGGSKASLGGGASSAIKNQLAGNKADLEYAQMKAKEYGNVKGGGTMRTREQFELWNDEVKRLQEERTTLEKMQDDYIKAGEKGTGIALTRDNGKVVNYYITNDGSSLREVVSGRKMNNSVSAKQAAKKLIENGNGKVTFLSKNQVKEIIEKRNEERAKTPDYELGNPFGERGRGKRVYRPRKNR